MWSKGVTILGCIAAVAGLVLMVCLVIKSPTGKPPMSQKERAPAPAAGDEKPSAPRELFDDLVEFVDEHDDITTDHTFFYQGGDVISIEGTFIDEDDEGSILVLGFRSLTTSNGVRVSTDGTDGILIYDPVIESIKIEASSIIRQQPDSQP
ncbi:MAG: hypothetical protein AAF226_01590 [Verrucomicrobiota bacterium]